MLLALDHEIDVYEYTDGSGGAVVSTDDPFDPYSNWWTRRRAVVPAFAEEVDGRERDFLFGDRPGEFWAFYFERNLLTPIGRPDTDFKRRWMLRESGTGLCWIVDFSPRVYDAPLAHIECYAKAISPAPVNHD